MFRWRHWEELWSSNLPDLEATKEVAARTIFVAIDTEPWFDSDGQNNNDTETCEIGITFLCPAVDQKEQTSGPPRTLEETYQRFSISSHCIRVRGRERPSGEHFWKGGTEAIMSVEPDGVEEAVVNILQTTQQKPRAFQFPHNSHGDLPPLYFVGFDLQAEFRILAHHYPRVLSCFTSWVDIQELTREITILPQAPSLRNTLIAFGFDRKIPTSPSPNERHNAGNDAMRSISDLATLLFFPPRSNELAQTCLNYRSNRARQREHQQRDKVNMKKSDLFPKRYPQPREKYPFRAKVDLPGAFFTGHPDAGILCEYFLKFRPVAAGINRLRVFGGWICLASLEELNLFVEEVHGLEDAERGGAWIATSQYDPGVVPAVAAAELNEFLKQKSISELAEKKRIRQERKETRMQYEGGDGSC